MYSSYTAAGGRSDPGGRLLAGMLADFTALQEQVKKWWACTTHPSFLQSEASRRDLWKVLLPLPPLFFMMFDAGMRFVVVMDFCMAAALLVVALMPAGSLCSDMTIAFAEALSLILHYSFCGGDSTNSFPVMCLLTTLTMAVAGIHSTMNALFVVAVAIAMPMCNLNISLVEVFPSIYVIALSCIAEYRAGKLLGHAFQDPAYKALFLGAESYPDPMSTSSSRTRSLHSRENVDLNAMYSRGSGASDLEEGENPIASLMEQFGLLASPSDSKRNPLASTVFEPSPSIKDLVPSTSPKGRLPLSSGKTGPVLRAVKLKGFKTGGVNVLFVENPDPASRINGRETFWNASRDFFIYHSQATKTWGIAKGRRFLQVREGQNNGLIHSPEGFELWDIDSDAAAPTKEWREWDDQAQTWSQRPDAGIASHGTMRQRVAGKLDVGVQTGQ